MELQGESVYYLVAWVLDAGSTLYGPRSLTYGLSRQSLRKAHADSNRKSPASIQRRRKSRL